MKRWLLPALAHIAVTIATVMAISSAIKYPEPIALAATVFGSVSAGGIALIMFWVFPPDRLQFLWQRVLVFVLVDFSLVGGCMACLMVSLGNP
jgi:hypothetical protein